VELRPTNDFTQQKTDAAIRLAIARDLQRIWSDVLQEPLPTDLRQVIDKLEQVTGEGQRRVGRVPG
jgi:hypothetical protein